MALGLSVEKWVGVSTGRYGGRDEVEGTGSQAPEGETHGKCEEESEWFLAGAGGTEEHRGRFLGQRGRGLDCAKHRGVQTPAWRQQGASKWANSAGA